MDNVRADRILSDDNVSLAKRVTTASPTVNHATVHQRLTANRPLGSAFVRNMLQEKNATSVNL